MSKEKPLTHEEKSAIEKWTGVFSQRQIAEKLGRHRSSIYRAQEWAGLEGKRHGPRCSDLSLNQEQRVLELLRIPWSQEKISRKLGVGLWQVRKTARKYKFKKPLWTPTPRQFLKIMNLALDHKYSAIDIARMVNGPYRPVLKICHRVLKCEKFIGGQTKNGLDSYLPMKWRETSMNPQQETTEEFFIRWVRIVNRIFGPELPPDLSTRVRLIVGLAFRTVPVAFRETFTEEEQHKVVQFFTDQIEAAVRMEPDCELPLGSVRVQ
jgi:transposase